MSNQTFNEWLLNFSENHRGLEVIVSHNYDNYGNLRILLIGCEGCLSKRISRLLNPSALRFLDISIDEFLIKTVQELYEQLTTEETNGSDH